MPPTGVYIHIPFCDRICPYCDFNKYVLKGQPVEEYLSALNKEMQATVTLQPPKDIKTIFVGGGTPTTLTPVQLHTFFTYIYDSFPSLEEDHEFTMEANPESTSIEKIQVMKDWGVNRLSFGVQTFQPELLKKLGRLHKPDDVYQALRIAKKKGFENLSIDLMFGLPGQTYKMFAETLDIAFSLEIPHFSAYSLKVEEGTFFHTLEKKGKLVLPPEEEEARMFELLMERMENQGYRQYEISNFARPGYESKHNLTYWKNREYYGIGAGAHGYVNKMRHENAGPLQEYIQLVDSQAGLPRIWQHQVQVEESIEDMMIMGLRTQAGVLKEDFYHRYGIDIENIYGSVLDQLIEKELLQTDGQRYRLTRKGILLGNEVFASFL